MNKNPRCRICGGFGFIGFVDYEKKPDYSKGEDRYVYYCMQHYNFEDVGKHHMKRLSEQMKRGLHR